MMCGRDEEAWPSVAPCWRIVMACAHCRAMNTCCRLCKKNIKGTKEDRWWHSIVVCAQEVKNEFKKKWKHSYISIARGMKSLLGVHLTYNHCMCCYHRCSLHHICMNHIGRWKVQVSNSMWCCKIHGDGNIVWNK